MFALSLVLFSVAFVEVVGEPTPSAPTDQVASVATANAIQSTTPITDVPPSPGVVLPTSTIILSPTDTPPPPTATPLPTDTPFPTDTPSPPPTDTPLPTATPLPTSTAIPTDTVAPGDTTIPGETPLPASSPTLTTTAIVTTTLTPTAASTPEGTPTPPPTVIPRPTDITIFGAEINRGHVGRMVEKAREANISWVRYNGIRWDEIEQTKGIRNWSAMNEVENELRRLNDAGITTVVIIRGTPDWAQKVSSTTCSSPIKEEELDTFASFVREVVIRYSTSEYGVKYWELGNEPDVDPDLLSGNPMPFGCWGDEDDPYYGGQYYAEMLKYAYPAIKKADSEAQVLSGGLLLDCDPDNPPEDSDCSPGRFLEGVLENDGASYFDIVSYHGYAFYGFWETTLQDWDLQLAKWKHRGGAMLGKLDFIQETLDAYQVKKPVLATEIGLLCFDTDCVDYRFEEEQTNYAIRTYIRAWANGLLGASWYTLNYAGWQEAGLMDKNQEPRQAYHALKFLTSHLVGTTFEQQRISNDGTFESYLFNKDEVRYEFHWSNGDATFDHPLPEGAEAAFRFGKTSAEDGYESVDIEGLSYVPVDFYPIMIEVR